MNRRHERQTVNRTDEIPTELSELLSELQADRGVQLSLEVPDVRRPRYSKRELRAEHGEARIPAVRVERGKVTDGPAVVYRDASDVRTILSLTWSMMILALLLVASGVGNIYQYLRRPDRIVVDGGTGRVLSINNRNYGREEGIEFGPDRLTQQDKIYITKEFVRAVYQVDPAALDPKFAYEHTCPNHCRQTSTPRSLQLSQICRLGIWLKLPTVPLATSSHRWLTATKLD